MLIRVQGKDRGEPYGEIVHLNLPHTIPYKSLGELVFRIDGIARFLEMSDKRPDFRTWDSQNEEMGSPSEESCSPAAGVQQSLEKGQVVCLELIGRQHMSLQGRLCGARKGEKEVYFRSALELMHLFSQM